MAEAIAALLPFAVGGAVCALPVDRISTVLEAPAITPIPRAPASVRGVINLRGNIVPVIDLRGLFRIGAADAANASAVIVAEAGEGRFASLYGLAVDSLRKVTRVDAGLIAREVPPGTGVPREYLAGVARLEGEYFLVLDAQAIFDLEAIFGRAEARERGT